MLQSFIHQQYLYDLFTLQLLEAGRNELPQVVTPFFGGLCPGFHGHEKRPGNILYHILGLNMYYSHEIPSQSLTNGSPEKNGTQKFNK